MNAGLPGTGIGGLFYIASALWMPVHRMVHGRTHASRAWPRIFSQMGMAGGILFALFATGWLLGLFMTADVISDIASGSGGAAVQNARNVVRWLAVLGTAGLLLMVLLTVEAAGLVVRRRARSDAAMPSSSPPTDLSRVRPGLRKVA